MKKPKTKKKRSTWSDVVDLVKKKHNIKDRVLPIPFGDEIPCPKVGDVIKSGDMTFIIGQISNDKPKWF